MEGGADTMPTVSESMPLLTMTGNGSALLSPTFTQGRLTLCEVGYDVAASKFCVDTNLH